MLTPKMLAAFAFFSILSKFTRSFNTALDDVINAEYRAEQNQSESPISNQVISWGDTQSIMHSMITKNRKKIQ